MKLKSVSSIHFISYNFQNLQNHLHFHNIFFFFFFFFSETFSKILLERKFWKIPRLVRSLHNRTTTLIISSRKKKIKINPFERILGQRKFQSSRKYFPTPISKKKKKKTPAKFLPTISPPAAKNIYIRNQQTPNNTQRIYSFTMTGGGSGEK